VRGGVFFKGKPEGVARRNEEKPLLLDTFGKASITWDRGWGGERCVPAAKEEGKGEKKKKLVFQVHLEERTSQGEKK